MKKKNVNPASKPYEEGLFVRLQDEKYAIGYLKEAMKEEEVVFLLALKDVTEARNIKYAHLARESGVSRENLYKVFSKKGDPKWSTITKILKALKIDLVPVILKPTG